jgi:hypothetical protein
MAAIDGTNRGKPKYIKTPEILFELFEEYRKKVKENPFQVVEQKKGNTIIPKNFDNENLKIEDLSLIAIPKEKPLTLVGFNNYCFYQGVISDISHYFANYEGRYADYLSTCNRIREIIADDQISGGMAQIYNPSITQRLNGLVDKQETNNNINMNISYEAMNED